MDYSLLNYRNSIQAAKEMNGNIKEAKKLQKNIDDYNSSEYLKIEQNRLGFKNLLNLYPNLEIMDLQFIGHPLSLCANGIRHETHISTTGAIQLVCAAISCALCGKVRIKITDNWYEPAIDEVMQFAESGKRKTPCIERLSKPFIKFINSINSSLKDKKIELRNLASEKICAYSTREILKYCIKERLAPSDYEEMFRRISENIDSKEAFIGKYKHFVSLLFRGGTKYGLEQNLINNGGYSAIIISEGEQFVLLVKDALNLLLNSHTQENYSRIVKGKTINILHPSLPFAICAQPDIALKLYTQDVLRDQGLLNRYMPYFYYNVPSFAGIGITPNLEEYNSKIEHLLCRFYTQQEEMELSILELDSEALAIVNEFRSEIEELRKSNEEISGWLSKLCGQAVRYACDIHFWNNVDTTFESKINKYEMVWGIITARSSIEHAKFAFSESGLVALEDAKKIIKKLGGVQGMYSRYMIVRDELSESGLMRIVNMRLSKLRNALRYLESKEYLTMIELPNGKIRVRLRS